MLTASSIAAILATVLGLSFQDPKIRDTGIAWQPLEFEYSNGPLASELDNTPNPFLDFRLSATLTAPSGKIYRVPGFFAGDGQGGPTGSTWRIRFTPDEPGNWEFVVSMRSGADLAINLNPLAGTPVLPLDGLSGAFEVAAPDPTAPGFDGKGRLEYADSFYLRFQDGSYFIKSGTDSPENLLCYAGFDNTRTYAGTHTYANHIADWQLGDPDWGNGLGRGIIGAINYLSSVGVNSLYFLPMNLGGDGQDVWPYAGTIVDPAGHPNNDNLHFDISKLEQWNIVFQHAQRRGLLLNFILSEGEIANKLELDNGNLGRERKLYYREMIARFGYLNAVVWNICEEYEIQYPLSPDDVRDFAGYIQDLDPYDHPITVHQFEDPLVSWAPFVGDSRFSLTSFQYPFATGREGEDVELWRSITLTAGRPLPICMDEMRRGSFSNATEQRRELIWPTILSGGHLEHILETLLETEDFRLFENHWKWTAEARRFLEMNVPFWEMKANDELVLAPGNPQCIFKNGETYAVYLPQGGGVQIDLRNSPTQDQFRIDWFNPRAGNYKPGGVVSGGAWRDLGDPAFPNDVAVLVRNLDTNPNAPPDLEMEISPIFAEFFLSDEDTVSDLNTESLIVEVDGEDYTTTIWEAIQNGQALFQVIDPWTIRVAVFDDWSQSTVRVEICDFQGLCAGDTYNKQ